MRTVLTATVLLVLAAPLQAQWTNRYTKVEGYNHHVYLEGYELPTMNAGPTDPAVSPDGRRVAFSARGWIWTLNPQTGRATRVTGGEHMDFRPAWSPDGRSLAFVRDDTRDTWVVVRRLADGREWTVDTPAIELDPAWTPGGELVYSSAVRGALDLWRRAIEGDQGQSEGDRVTARPGIEVKPSVSADGSTLVYLHKGGGDRIVARDLATGDEVELATERIVSQTRPAVSPDGRLVAYNWPTQDGYELRLVMVDDPGTSLRLTTGRRGLPLAPAWSPDGEWIWFTEAGADEVMRLYRIARDGGTPVEVPVRAWDWGVDVGTVRVLTTDEGMTTADGGMEGRGDRTLPLPARLSVRDGSGHPVVPTTGYAQFGLQDGRIFFYSPGVIELTVPAGEATVSAVQGLTTPEVTRTVRVRPGQVTEVTLTLEHVWDARQAGYLSGDHHFHLNYGGPYDLDPEDLFPMMAGENLDVATPLLANLHNRFEEQDLWGWEHAGGLPLIQFGQEVRSHFLGHVGLLDTRTLFWPWIWGPFYQVYGRDDRPNAAPLGHARAQGGLGGYVHPIDDRDPFAEGNEGNSPVMLAVDGILGNMDWLEVGCLWTDEIGTAEMWYRFLNLGVPIALEAGTDVMNDYYRTMAIGTTRLYVQTHGETNLDAYYKGFREGRSFVSTGPIIEFTAAGAAPGDAVSGERELPFALELASAVPVDVVEVLVNGEVMWSDDGLDQPGTRTYSGRIEVPAGGWIAARAHGGAPVWPAMDQVIFAHTSPVWLGEVGSTDPGAMRRAAEDLLPVVDAAERRLRQGYGETPTPRVLEMFRAARERLAEAANAR